jgi:hypothetical protein
MSSQKKVTFAEENEEKSGRFKGKHSLDSDEESDGQGEGIFVAIDLALIWRQLMFYLKSIFQIEHQLSPNHIIISSFTR